MKPKYGHLMEESDIGSGEKTPAEMEDLEQTRHLREQQEQAMQQAHPLDGGSLQQVTEEQQFINQHESHTPHGVTDSPEAEGQAAGGQEQPKEQKAAMPPKTVQKAQRSASAHGRTGQ